jgi:hypothetical protein
MSNGSQSRNGVLIAIALIGGLVFAIYAFLHDKELAADLFKALLGLSGGATAGG